MRHVAIAAHTLAHALVFVAAVGVGVIVHLDSGAVRRAAVGRLNDVLASALPGRIVIRQVGQLGLGGAGEVDATVFDPDGTPIIVARGVSAQITTLALVESLVGGGAVVVTIPRVDIASVDVALDPGPDGRLRLERAFVRAPAPPSGPSNARPIHLSLPDIEVAHATAHGAPAPSVDVDAEATRLAAALDLDDSALRLDLVRVDLTARGLPPGSTTHGALQAHFTQPTGAEGTRMVRATWRGTVGDLPAGVDAAVDGDRVRASVDAPSIDPAALAAIWPSSPLQQAGAAHVDVDGAFPTFQLSLRATTGASRLAVVGPVSLSGTRGASLHIDATSMDARAVGGPQSDLRLEGDAMVAAPADGSIGAVAAIDVSGQVAGVRVPASSLAAQLTRDATGGALQGHAQLVAREPGAPCRVVADLKPKGDSFQVAFQASVHVPDLDAVARAGPIAQGHIDLTSRGSVDLSTKHVDASVDATAGDLETGPLKVGSMEVHGRAVGALASPVIDANVTGQALEVGPLRLAHVDAALHGPLSAAELSLRVGGEGQWLRAKATVGAAAGSASARDLEIEAERGSERVHVRAPLLSVSAREQRIDDLAVRGFGDALRASVRSTPGELQLRGRSRGLDLAKIARFAGIPGSPAGHLAVDVDATIRRTSGQGHVTVDLTQASVESLHDAEAHVDVTLAGRTFSGSAVARVGDVVTLDVESSEVTIGGSAPLGPSSWTAAWGTLAVDGHIDLSALYKELPAGTLPFSRLKGQLEVQGHVGRDSATDMSPDLDLSARTAGLVIDGPPTTPWVVEGIDADADLTIDGVTARTALEARAVDAHGLLVSIGFSSDRLPYSRIFARDPQLPTLLRATPFAGAVTIPNRDLADFPAVLGTRGTHGKIAGSVSWDGTVDAPSVDLYAALERLRADAGVFTLPFDLEAGGHYDGSHASVTFVAADRSKPLLDATAALDVRASDVIDQLLPAHAPLAWRASGSANLLRFPVQTLAVLDSDQVRGHVSGKLSLDGLHDDAKAAVDLSSDDLVVGEIACKAASTKASIDGHTIDATANVAETDGSIQVTAHAGTRWGAAMAPSLDTTQPADVSLVAKTFRAEILQPLVSTVFAELDGRLDGSARVQIDPASQTFRPQGSLKVTDGIFELASVGGEFHNATADLDVTPDGVVRLQNVSAQGLSGKVQAAASARFDGTKFAGARGLIQVPRQDPLPLVFDGVQVGLFQGQVSVAVDPITAAGGGLAVNVDVPQAQVTLPDRSTRSIQSLGPLERVTVGAQVPSGAFKAVQLDGPTQGASTTTATARAPLNVTVNLGKDFEVRQGTTLDVFLTGAPSVRVTNTVRASGQVRLERGTIFVQGKTFTIENGTVTFVDDPTNPQVVLTASWPAPDGSTIYADFIGPLKTGKVTLRSDPSHTQNEILSLLLFGTTDDQATPASSSQQTGAVSAAGGVAGGVATAPINQALGGVNQMLDKFGLVGGISTRVDTSQPTPMPEVQLQIARDISIQVAWVLGVPPPGQNPDSTLFTLDWQFLRSWSLEGTIGDAGTSILNLIWQHRY